MSGLRSGGWGDVSRGVLISSLGLLVFGSLSLGLTASASDWPPPSSSPGLPSAGVPAVDSSESPAPDPTPDDGSSTDPSETPSPEIIPEWDRELPPDEIASPTPEPTPVEVVPVEEVTELLADFVPASDTEEAEQAPAVDVEPYLFALTVACSATALGSIGSMIGGWRR